MRHITLLFLIGFLCIGTTISAQTSPLPSPIPFGKCVNFGNALEAPNEGEWGLVIEEDFMATLANAGFDTVRIPIKWSGHAQTTAPYTINATFMARIVEVVDWAMDANLQVVLNIHHYDEITSTPPADHTARINAIWSQIATQFAGYPPTLAFELLNEPHGTLTAMLWNNLYPQLITTIRATNPTRLLIFGGIQWNSHLTLNQLVLPTDKSNLMATFHYYSPFEFTHQGAEWIDNSDPWLGTTWGTVTEYETVADDFEAVRLWSEANAIPVWLGEFGSYYKADIASRLLYTEAVRSTAEANGMGWCYWEFAAGFGIYDKNTDLFNDLYRALIPEGTFTEVEMNEQAFLAQLQATAQVMNSPIYPLLVDIIPNGAVITLSYNNTATGTAQIQFVTHGLVRVVITQTTGTFSDDIQRDLPSMILTTFDTFLAQHAITDVVLEGIRLTLTAVVFQL